MSSLTDGLPDALRTVRTRPLFVMHLNVRKLQIVGATLGAHRRIRVRRGLLLPGEWAAGRSPPRPPQSPPGRSFAAGGIPGWSALPLRAFYSGD